MPKMYTLEPLSSGKKLPDYSNNPKPASRHPSNKPKRKKMYPANAIKKPAQESFSYAMKPSLSVAPRADRQFSKQVEWAK